MSEEPEVRYLGDVQKLSLGPDDVVVIKSPVLLSGEQDWRIRDQVQAILGKDRKVMVLSGGMEVGILTPPPVPAEKLKEEWERAYGKPAPKDELLSKWARPRFRDLLRI